MATAMAIQYLWSGYLFVVYCMRGVLGVAGEGIFTVQAMIISRYSSGNYEVVMGLALSLPFLFDSINSIVTTITYDSTHSMALPWVIGCGVCLLSLAAGLALIKIYVNRARYSQ